MSRRHMNQASTFLFIVFLVAHPAQADGQTVNYRFSDKMPFNAVPMELMEEYRALGGRLARVETARVTLQGQLIDIKGTRSVQVVWQLPGVARLDEGGGINRTLTFDGDRLTSSTGLIGVEEANLFEGLIADLPENLFRLFADGPPLRLFARGAQLTTTPPVQRAVRVDVFEVQPVSLLASKALPGPHIKMLTFDSNTRLLRATYYSKVVDGVTASFETRFEEWRSLSGFAFPGEIIRMVGGKEVFRFQVVTAEAGPKLPEANFRQ